MLQVRIDDDLKNKASKLFNELGIDLSTAVRVFLIKCISVGGIPFEIGINNSTIEALATLERVSQKSKELGNDKLALEEKNVIVDESRNK